VKKCIYLTEGECEEKLVKALKETPSMIIPGKVKRFNVVQNILPANILMQFEPGSTVVLVFDTDKKETAILEKNVKLLRTPKLNVEVRTVLQVLNFEDEIESATDVAKAPDLTKSKTIDDFKHAVNRMKDTEFRNPLKRHKLDLVQLWSKSAPSGFGFIEQDGARIKTTGKCI
jgi:hypothetical protein